MVGPKGYNLNGGYNKDLPIILTLDVASAHHRGTADCRLTKMPTIYSFPAQVSHVCAYHCSLQKKTEELPFRHFAPRAIKLIYIYWSETPHFHLYHTLPLCRFSYPCFAAPVASVISRLRSQSTPPVLRGLLCLCRRTHLSPLNPRIFYAAILAYGFFARCNALFIRSICPTGEFSFLAIQAYFCFWFTVSLIKQSWALWARYFFGGFLY